jgi:hypothetical protein
VPTFTSNDSLDVSYIERVSITVDGANGGDGSASAQLYSELGEAAEGALGGNGGRATGDLDTSNIDTLYIRFPGGGNGPSVSETVVGGTATADAGNGGRGADVRVDGTAQSDIAIEAGGGGGGGAAASDHDDYSSTADAGGGGDDGQNGGGASDDLDSVNGGTAEAQSGLTGADGPSDSRAQTYAVAVAAAGGGGGGLTGGGVGGVHVAAQDTSSSSDASAGGGGGGGTYTGGVTNASSTQGGTQNTSGQVEITIEEMSLYAPTQSTNLVFSSADFTVTGAAGVNAPTQTLSLDHNQYAVGQGLTAPSQSLSLNSPQADVTGAGSADLTPSVQSLLVSHPLEAFAFDVWVIDEQPIGTTTSENATHQNLQLTTRVETQDLLDTLRSLKSDEGKVDVLPRDDGGFVAVDRADGGNTYHVLPPAERLPLRREQDVHVERYEESLVSQSVDEWDVELELIKSTNRTDSPSSPDTEGYRNGAVFDASFPMVFARPGLEWVFGTRYGEIQTGRVDADVVGSGEQGVRRFDIVARLTFAQAHVFEAALNRVGGARVRDIPDATNTVVDDTDNDVVTVSVDPAGGNGVVPTGDYVVSGWESERLNDAVQEVSFRITGPK